MDREIAIEPIMKALEDAALGSRDLLRDLLSDWVVAPYMLDGKVVACAIVKGAEIHFAITPEFQGRLITRARAREFLAPLLTRYGYLTTRMLKGHGDIAQEIGFIRRLGFTKTWVAGDTAYYMLTRLPFERKPKCQS